ncbi:MAG: TraB/GumN family protein [Idiomarina sp.]|nr:TraB/GumN family protein [Idiomarina sp.]
MGFVKAFAVLLVVLFSTPTYAEVLYKVSYGEQTWWVLGTIHIGEPDMQLSKQSEQAFSESEEVWFELSPEELQRAALLLFQQGASATTLSSQVEPELWQRFETTLSEHGIVAGAFNNLEPWLMEIMVLMQLALTEGFDVEYGSEAQLMQWAGAQNTPMFGFETAQDQIDALRTGSEQSVAEAIEELLESLHNGAAEIAVLADAWRAGDIQELMLLVRESMNERQLDALLWQRNLAWFAKLQTMLDETDSATRMIAVGAAHLGDEFGLLQLFHDAGAEIKNYSTAAQ